MAEGIKRQTLSTRDGRGTRREAEQKGEGQTGNDRASLHDSPLIEDALVPRSPRCPRELPRPSFSTSMLAISVNMQCSQDSVARSSDHDSDNGEEKAAPLWHDLLKGTTMLDQETSARGTYQAGPLTVCPPTSCL